MRIIRCLLVISGALLFCSHLNSCVYSRTRLAAFEPVGSTAEISSPTKVHLFDGSVGVFSGGMLFVEGVGIEGNGILYDLTRVQSQQVSSIPIEDIAFLEYYVKEIESGPILGVLGSAVFFLAAIQNSDIHKYFFGSCPTVYSLDESGPALQAECFSYSISEASETDDLDRINGVRDNNGELTLNVRNEAFETHYINLMELIVADYPESYEAFPMNRQFPESKRQILLLGEESELTGAETRDGENVLSLIKERDQSWYQSDVAAVEALTSVVSKDWIDVTVVAPESADSMVVAIRFRNTLFHTVEFYDLVLGAQGAESLDWIGVEMADSKYASSVYQQYRKYFGLQANLWTGETFEEVAFIDDTGPIAWRKVAFKVAVPDAKEILLRFSFLPDHVMLDWVSVSFQICNDFTVQTGVCSSLERIGENAAILPADLIQERDSAYLVSQPSDSYMLTFDVGRQPENSDRAYFLHSGGFYIEWIRQAWLNSASDESVEATFKLDDAAISHAASMWLKKKSLYEAMFYSTKIVVEGGKKR